jgi:subtilisin family serine protease
MSHKLRFIALVLLALNISSAAFAGQYSSSFSQYLADHRTEGKVTAIITMADQVNLRAIQDQLYAQHADRRLWHETVVRALQEKATISQANLLSVLSSLQQSGQVQDYKSFWLGNLVIITATPATFEQLVTRQDILQVSPNYPIESVEPVSQPNNDDIPLITGHEIGADRIHAAECWAMGITGEGRLVSHLDTGVDGNHPALTERWRGNADPRYADHPEWAWCDPLTNTTYPQDWGQHGTHTMGTICGRSTTTDDTVGVAIDAQWISAGVIDRQSIPRTVQDALTAFEWVADPDLDPSTVWDVPDVCSNSWGVGPNIGGYPHCDDMFWTALDACEAAGIVVVFAAGNEGAGGLRVPADRATTDLTSFAVGAVDGDNPDLPIAYFSSLGPTFCTPDGSEAIKPEIVAPGVNIRSSIPGGGYAGGWSGTSMATPHIAGIVALMRQANPNLTSEQVRQILLDTAVETPSDITPGDDNTFGHGIVNAFAAVQSAQALLNGWGTLSGIIRDQASATPLPGARISVVGRPWSAVANPGTGQYILFVPADTAWTVRVEYPPTHLPILDTITIVENDTIYQNYALEGKVTVALKASFGNPNNVDYRSFYLKGSWNTDGFYDASWSAPLIEIKDDGLAPDQTAGDGIFSGSVMLARDLTHIYTWAIYTENYGGEGARLQNGASFQITSLVPPAVPTLSVNPSGSDHNWGISAFGTNSLNFDLARVDANHPTKWAAACSLFQGVSYAFHFRVMHSSVAKYGAGGIDGDSIRYTPPVSSAYDFIFDDLNDSYIVQMSGTEGPPVQVTAQSGLDGHIPVSWLPPGTTESTELFYDDGTCQNGWRYFSDDDLIANLFTPDAYPMVVDSVMIHLFTEGDPNWPWPDGNPDPVGISIFLDDGTGFPQPDPVFYTEVTGELGQPWLRIDVPDIMVSEGNFWVAMQNLPSGSEEGLGQDAATDYPANKWSRHGGNWMVQDIYAGDQMIRAKVFGGSRDRWLSLDSSPAVEIPAKIRVGGNPEFTDGTSQPHALLSAINGPRFNRMAYHPNKIRNDTPVIMDNEVLVGYNLYRDVNPGPFNRPAQTKINTGLIIATLYDDWGTDIHGPIVNGTTYHYQASAVYDIGSGQFVEVGPSNEVTGVAENHPPANPMNLTGYAAGHDVHLTWNRNTDYDIQSYKVYRRDPDQQSYTLIATVTHPDTTFHEVIAVNGIYKYKIAAFDRGGMQSDGFSNSLNIAIGAIPPCNLRASDNQEFQVSLVWNHPGGCGGDMTVLVIGGEYTSGDASVFMDEMRTYSDVVQIDYFDARTATPTMEDLTPYNVVIVWSNYQFNDAAGLGDLLADYVDNGGGVVLNEFCFAEVWALQGRIMNEYSPVSTGNRQLITHSLGDFDPVHPIMEGVTAATEFFQAGVTLANGGVLVAAFDDGNPLVAVNPDLPVVAVNGYVGNQRQFTGDMSLIAHNALKYVSSGPSAIIPERYNVYKSTSSGGPFNLLATLPGTQRTYIDAPLPNGVDYWYRVTDMVGSEESEPSNVAIGRAIWILRNHNPFPPGSGFNPTNGEEVLSLTPLISWSYGFDPDSTDTSGTLSYTIRLALDSLFAEFDYCDTTGMGLNQITPVDELLDNTHYFYEIKTIDDGGLSSDWSTRQDFWTNHYNYPPEPFPLMEPMSGTKQVVANAHFTWGSTLDLDPHSSFTYSIQFSPDSLFRYNVGAHSNLTDTTITINTDSIALSGQIFWRVVAVDNDSLIRIGGMPEQVRQLIIIPPGDANGSGSATGLDVSFLVNYFKGRNSGPDPLLAGDANGSCTTTGPDVTYLVRYFKGIGPAPRRCGS